MILTPLKIAAIKAEYQLILDVLQQTNFRKSEAAKILGIDRSSINNKVRRYKLALEQEANAIPGTV